MSLWFVSAPFVLLFGFFWYLLFLLIVNPGFRFLICFLSVFDFQFDSFLTLLLSHVSVDGLNSGFLVMVFRLL